MGYLVDDTLLEKEDRVIITWSDGRKTEAKYKDTFGFTHYFEDVETKNEIKLSNRFMRLKFIRIKKIEN